MSTELRPGYKKTEAGVIPEDWEAEALGPHVEIKSGESPSLFRFESDGVPYFKVEQLNNNNKYLLETSYFIRGNKKVPRGSLIFPKRGASILLNKVRILEKDSFMDTNLMTLTPKTLVNHEFLYYAITHIELWRIADTTSIPQINNKHIIPLVIAFPPTKAEQEAIAEALSDADALIESLEQLITKKRHLKQGAMQELLTGKKRLPGFQVNPDYKQTELGMIPVDWEVKKLGSISNITKLAGFEYSLHFNSYNDGGDIIVVRGTNITHNKLDLSDIKTIPSSTSNKLQRSKLFKNDLVFAYVGTIGPVYLIEDNDKYHLGPNTSKITVGNESSPQFLYHYFTSRLLKNETVDNISTGAQPSLSMLKIRSFRVILPTRSEQTAIATILSDMDAEIETLETKLAKTRSLKQGMMHNLLTGRIRLIESGKLRMESGG